MKNHTNHWEGIKTNRRKILIAYVSGRKREKRNENVKNDNQAYRKQTKVIQNKE